MNPAETSELPAIDVPVTEEQPAPEGYAAPLLALAVVFLVITAWNLNIQSIANPDEPRYAAPARIMLDSNQWRDWLIPEFNTQPRLLKPIFFYWLIAGAGFAGKAAGLALATAFRLGPISMGLLGVIGTYLLGRKLFGARAGFISAAIVMTTYFYHQISRELVVDMTLTAWLLWAWYFCFVALERLAIRHPHFPKRADEVQVARSPFFPLLGFYLCLGLACMTKGPALVALFVVVPLLVYLWWDGRLSHLLYAGAWWGAPLALGIGCWWFYAVQEQGFDIISILRTENLSRAVGKKDHQDYIPFLFYVERLGGGFAPWCVLFPFAALWTIMLSGKAAEESEDAGLSSTSVKFLLSALAVPFLILGFIVSKRELYILPLYPFIALWLGVFLENTILLRRERESAPLAAAGFVMGGLVLLAAAVILALLPQKWGAGEGERFMVGLFGFGISVGLLSAARSLKRGARYAAVLQLLAVAAALCLGFETIARPMRERALDTERFYAAVSEKLADKKVVLFGLSSNEAVWYLDRRKEPIDDIRRPDLKVRFFESPGTILLAARTELDRSPELDKSIQSIPDGVIRRGKDIFVLAIPDPNHPPDESVFKGKLNKAETVQD